MRKRQVSTEGKQVSRLYVIATAVCSFAFHISFKGSYYTYLIRFCILDGRQLAAEYGAKFTETSTMLNHKVDNLLVGILSQIKEQGRQSVKSSKKTNKSGFKKSVKGLVNKIVHRGSGKKSRAATP